MNPTKSLDEWLDEIESTIQRPSKLTELQQAALVKSIPNDSKSTKRFVKFLANNPDSTSARVRGQTGITNLIEASLLATEKIFKKGYFISYRLMGDELNLTEYWGISQIPDHAKHCKTPEELSNYVNQLGQSLIRASKERSKALEAGGEA